MNSIKSVIQCVLAAALPTLFLAACSGGGGGGARAAACANGEATYPGQCANGVIDQEKPVCGDGYHSENGFCVKDSLICPDNQHADGDQCVDNRLHVQVASESLCRVERNGTTRFIVQFVTRDEDGQLIDPELNSVNEPTQLASELFVDRQSVDIESLLSRESKLLQSNLVLSLVLDSSFSMTRHNPPAFAPMKDAAVAILHDTSNLWSNINSDFHWELAWFNEYIFRPAKDSNGNDWSIESIRQIPTPSEGTVTGLYKAVHHMAKVHADLHSQGVAAGPRDQHIMVVLSDGADNHSWHDNAAHQTDGSVNGINWTELGAPETNLSEVLVSLGGVPNLRTHVIGLGNSVDHEELEMMASAGSGQYFFGSSANTLSQLFEDVKKEFVTMQTLGVEVPLRPGQYEFSLRTRHVRTGAEGFEYFNIDVGPDMAACPEPAAE